MRYSPDRHFLHPVARPHTNDYLTGAGVTTNAYIKYNDGLYHVRIDFLVNNRDIDNYVSKGDAICMAMLYCSGTGWRQAIPPSDSDIWSAEDTIFQGLLTGSVEIHPAIIAKHSFSLSTENTHDEYGDTPIPLSKGEPLAVLPWWDWEVERPLRRVESIFNLVHANNELGERLFRVVADHRSTYVNIEMEPDTLRKFEQVREKYRTFPTVYLAALTETLAKFWFLQSRVHKSDIDPDGWFAMLKSEVRRRGYTFESECDDEEESLPSIQLGVIAQQILSDPQTPLDLVLSIQEDYEESEEGYD